MRVAAAVAMVLAFVDATARPVPFQEGAVSREEILAAARAVMITAQHCTLITLDEQGHPQARIMEPFAPGDDMTVWLATNRATRKAAQIRRDPRATLVYFDQENPGYVTLLGWARLVDDPAVRRSRWKEAWRPFYPDGPEGDAYVLIEFTPSRVEVVSIAHGIASDPLARAPRSSI